MLVSEPGRDSSAQTDRRREHLVGFVVGYRADLIVDGGVAFASAPIQERNALRLETHREVQALDRA